MFPILPILILLLLGPAKAERLAIEGRLPASFLAFHRAPIRATVVAPAEQTAARTAALRNGLPTPSPGTAPEPLRRAAVQEILLPACPPRAGPSVA